MSAERLIEKHTQKGPKNEGEHLLPTSGAQRNAGQQLYSDLRSIAFVCVGCVGTVLSSTPASGGKMRPAVVRREID